MQRVIRVSLSLQGDGFKRSVCFRTLNAVRVRWNHTCCAKLNFRRLIKFKIKNDLIRIMKSERVSDQVRKKCMKNWGICYTGNDVTRSILTIRPDTDAAWQWNCKIVVLYVFGIKSVSIVLIFFYLPQTNRRQYSLQSLWNKKIFTRKTSTWLLQTNPFWLHIL